MAKILIIGAGRSTSSLIDYLLKNFKFDVSNASERENFIKSNDLIISMLPAFMHADVARDCVRLGKHMATASYVSEEMKELDAEAKKKSLLLLNEVGLDPGIDHASAMKVIHEIQKKGGEVTSFKSYCGGLVAPESNDNPWGYKFSWNPRNVVLAGHGTAQFIDEGKLKFIPYNRIFTQIDTIEVDGHGKFDAYANRDSISYREPYGLQTVQTLIRGTLRETGYCKAWNVFVKLGWTDDAYKIKDADQLTYTQLLDSFLPKGNLSVKDKLKQFMGKEWETDFDEKLDYLELFSDKKIRLKEGSPAQLLQDLLEEKWKLKHGDKDMIVMQHQFEFTSPVSQMRDTPSRGGQNPVKKLHSSLVVIGDDEIHTAMAKTVGLPLAITVKNFLTGKFKLNGVQIPIVPEIYEPLLKELEDHKIIFTEKEIG
jgi:saccharopine dehydrogenase-like NADP-dependent oxidoreductase